jgi:hypothetical protein
MYGTLTVRGEAHMKALGLIFFIFCGILPAAATADAADCEVVDTYFFERSQDEIVTGWTAGIPHRQLKTAVYPCARLTVKNTDWLVKRTSALRVTGTFTDRSTARVSPSCGDERILPGGKFSCQVCFESEASIHSVTCEFR